MVCGAAADFSADCDRTKLENHLTTKRQIPARQLLFVVVGAACAPLFRPKTWKLHGRERKVDAQ